MYSPELWVAGKWPTFTFVGADAVGTDAAGAVAGAAPEGAAAGAAALAFSGRAPAGWALGLAAGGAAQARARMSGTIARNRPRRGIAMPPVGAARHRRAWPTHSRRALGT